MDYLIPSEILLEIAYYLDFNDKLTLRYINQRFYNLIDLAKLIPNVNIWYYRYQFNNKVRRLSAFKDYIHKDDTHKINDASLIKPVHRYKFDVDSFFINGLESTITSAGYIKLPVSNFTSMYSSNYKNNRYSISVSMYGDLVTQIIIKGKNISAMNLYTLYNRINNPYDYTYDNADFICCGFNQLTPSSLYYTGISVTADEISDIYLEYAFINHKDNQKILKKLFS